MLQRQAWGSQLCIFTKPGKACLNHVCVSDACLHHIQNNLSAPSWASVLHCHNQHCLVSFAQLLGMFMPVGCAQAGMYMQEHRCICLSGWSFCESWYQTFSVYYRIASPTRNLFAAFPSLKFSSCTVASTCKSTVKPIENRQL